MQHIFRFYGRAHHEWCRWLYFFHATCPHHHPFYPMKMSSLFELWVSVRSPSGHTPGFRYECSVYNIHHVRVQVSRLESVVEAVKTESTPVNIIRQILYFIWPLFLHNSFYTLSHLWDLHGKHSNDDLPPSPHKQAIVACCVVQCVFLQACPPCLRAAGDLFYVFALWGLQRRKKIISLSISIRFSPTRGIIVDGACPEM